jgi:hypothetical protein
MTDKTEFSLDISVNPASGLEPLPDLVACDLCKAYPVSDGTLLLHNTRNGKRAMVTPEVYASLLICIKFQSLDQHVANIIAKHPGMQGQQADIHKVLKKMLDDGMMISAKKVSKRLKSAVNISTLKKDAAKPVVAIITWERPQALERLLASIAANCNTKEFHRLYVIDDSRITENISGNKALVEKFASAMDTPLRYFGQEEQDKLLNDLVMRLPDNEDAIRFLADQSRWRSHWTSGLARNLALLVSSGHHLVMMDDDTICDVFSPPQPKPNIRFSDDPREADFFGNEQEWAALHQPMNPDPVNRHMQCLGLTFSEALAVLGESHLKPTGFSNATALEVSELQADSPVLMTECGSLGCPGTTRNTWLPNMAPDSLKQMLASQEKTTYSLTSRKVWSGRNQPQFTPRPNMSAMTGFDNRQMLPPYFPIERGEDKLFGFLLDFIFPQAVTLDFPWAIQHLPIPEREWRSGDLNFTPSDSFPMFFFGMILEYKSSCRSGTPTERLSALSAWFKDLAATPGDSLARMYRDCRLRDSSERLQQLNTLLTMADQTPVNWQNYLRNGIQQLSADLDKVSRTDFPVRGLGFATALEAWPEIRKAAASILTQNT